MRMKSILIFITFISFYSLTSAQVIKSTHLDSVYNEFLHIRRYQTGTNNAPLLYPDTTHIKCAFGIVNEIRMNFNSFSPKQKIILKLLLDRPKTDTSFVTPNGFFRVHYDLSGSNAPTYSLDSLAIALDSAYNFEVNYLGYPPPPPDNGNGGDNRYDIYILNLSNTYGYTTPENLIPQSNQRYTSYMAIDNSFKGFYTTGINAARVTVAHEFHHSIQIGDYIDRYDQDEFFYELTSTSMEHFVYPSIHDYYQYLPYYFNNTQACLGENGGLSEYALAIWNIFLKDNFGYDIIKKQWQLMPNERALKAISDSFSDYNSSFGEQFNKFGIWTFFTNYRSDEDNDKHFINASDYPVIKPIDNLNINNPEIPPVNINTHPVTNNFIQFVNLYNYNNDSRYRDTIFALITNDDIGSGISNPDSSAKFQYTLFLTPSEGAVKLGQFQYYEKFNTNKPSFWILAATVNNQIAVAGKYFTQNSNFAYPSPFKYNNTDLYIKIPAIPDQFNSAHIYIYTSSMKLVYSTYRQVVLDSGKKVIIWDGMDSQNKKLSSGVYIYVMKSGSTTKIGKLVIFNN